MTRYLVAIAAVFAGWLARLSLSEVLGPSVPFATLFPAVVVAARWGGFGPSILAVVLSVLVVLFSDSAQPFHFGSAPIDWTRIGVFVFGSTFVSALISGVMSARAREAKSLLQVHFETQRLKQAEESLTTSNLELERARDLLQTTLSSIGDAVIATDANARITFLNPVAQQITGWSHAEAAGRPVTDVFAIQNNYPLVPVQDPVSIVLREGTNAALSKHTILLNRVGRAIPIEDTATPIRDQHQRILGAVLIFRDVSERRTVEEALQQSEERLKLALDAGKIGAWDWKLIEDHIRWTDQAHAIYGFTEEHEPATWEQYIRLVHPDDRDQVSEAIQDALHHGARYDLTFRILRADGSIRWVADTGLVLRDRKGTAVRMLGAVTDVTASKQSQDEIRQQWRTFDTALSHTPDHMFIYDRQGRFEYANQAMLTLWQCSLDDILGKTLLDLNYPRDLGEKIAKQHQQVIETRQPLRDQTTFSGPSGETRNYDYILVPVFATDGTVEAVAGSSRDVTDRIVSEKALRESEERLAFALEAGGGVGAWDWDILNDRVYANPMFARFYSVDPQEAAEGAPVSRFRIDVHPDDLERFNSSLAEAVRSGGIFAEEFRIVRPEGVRWLYARGRCHRDEAGKPVRLPGVAFDITDRKRAGENLRESQQRLRAIYDGTYEYIGLIAPDGTLLEANRSSLSFDNSSREELMGAKFWDCPWFAFTPGAAETARQAVLRAAAGEFVRYQTLIADRSGRKATFDISLYPIRNEQGEVVLIVPEGRDISELIEVEDTLRQTNSELTRVNRDLEEFAYVASHDLQEALRTVSIHSQLLLREAGAGSARVAASAAFVREGVSRMDNLLKDLLKFSETVHSDEPLGTADLSASLSEALLVLQHRIKENGAVISAGALPLVRGETSQMCHVFQNLLSNALKYRRADGNPAVTITAERHGNEWIVSVGDNGIGFEQAYAERIFGLFKRLHRQEYPGTGLGLAICKRIVERYGGRIWAKSAPGQGSTFYFALPVAPHSQVSA